MSTNASVTTTSTSRAALSNTLSEQYTVRGVGRSTNIAALESIVMEAHSGAPVYMRQIADVRISGAPRQGAVTQNGIGETLSGMVIMLKGQNSKTVIERVKQTVEAMRSSLPESVNLVPFYDQSEVIDGTIRTVRNNLLEGGALVIAVLFLSLGQIRAAILTALIIPLSLLSAFVGMRLSDITANLMSLGAVDFGVVIDGAVVVVDNCVRRIDEEAESGRVVNMLETVRSATHEVALPVLAGVVIVLGVYVPILTLQGLEGRMFRPMAVTVCAAVAAGLVLALFAPAHRMQVLLVQDAGDCRPVGLQSDPASLPAHPERRPQPPRRRCIDRTDRDRLGHRVRGLPRHGVHAPPR